MEARINPSPKSCDSTQVYYAAYSRKAKRQTFKRLAISPFGPAMAFDDRAPLPRLRLRLGVIGLALMSLGTAIQPTNASPEKPLQANGHAVHSGAELGEAAWSRYLASGRNCRSRIDGSNSDVVRQVKARAGSPDTFVHIETTTWPAANGQHGLTMMYRAGNGQHGADVHEARASLDPASCQARLLSIS